MINIKPFLYDLLTNINHVNCRIVFLQIQMQNIFKILNILVSIKQNVAKIKIKIEYIKLFIKKLNLFLHF